MNMRRGSSLLEAVLAMTLLVTAFVAIAQLMSVAARRRAETARREAAIHEVANLMERVLWHARRGGDRQLPGDFALTAEAQAQLPAARLQIETERESGRGNGTRVLISIDWLDSAGQRVAPVQLAGWFFEDGATVP